MNLTNNNTNLINTPENTESVHKRPHDDVLNLDANTGKIRILQGFNK